MKKILLYIVLTILFSCSGNSKNGIKDPKLLYQSSGFEKYVLPQIPYWVNHSKSASCFRPFPFKFLNVKNVQASYFLNYHQALQLQYSYNIRSAEDATKKSEIKNTLKTEEANFYKASEMIQSGVYSFIQPKLKRVHLLWLESFSGDVEKLKKALLHKDMNEAPPIIFSLCKSYEELKKYLEKNNLDQLTTKILSSEILSPYNPIGELQTGFYFYPFSFFGEDKEIYLYVGGSEIPQELVGEYKVKKIK